MTTSEPAKVPDASQEPSPPGDKDVFDALLRQAVSRDEADQSSEETSSQG